MCSLLKYYIARKGDVCTEGKFAFVRFIMAKGLSDEKIHKIKWI